MAAAEDIRPDIRALEASCPWERADFQADLALLADSTATAARRFAADARVLARLVEQVPRCALDERGATAWTSFRREVAVARKVSDQAAAAEIRTAVRLTTVLPHAMDLLEAGVLTVARAKTFVTELEIYDDELARQIDADLADRAARLPAWRIAQEVRRAVLVLEPEAAAAREASKTASRRMSLFPDSDGQASVFLFGPAVPLTRWYGTVDARARALRQAGDPRTLDNLRFDLATSVFPCATHPPADPTTADPSTVSDPSAVSDPGTVPGADNPADRGATAPDRAGAGAASGLPDAAAGLRPGGVEPASADCRLSRPVQAMIVVPVETALGLSHEPGWLDGYGWISAPTCRQLLVEAELRRVCAQTSTGTLVDLDHHLGRPPPTPDGLRDALLSMVSGQIELSDLGWRAEPEHDPTDPLRAYVTLRDRTCDGPTGSQLSARRCDLDHTTAHPHGPTAAWNLAARSRRTHQLKHYGWTPLRTPTSTVWTSPAGQLIDVPRHHRPPPGIDPDPHGQPAVLPDPHQLAATDQWQLQASTDDDIPPWLPTQELPPPTDWTWLHQPADAPF